jgi:hypothetical protein
MGSLSFLLAVVILISVPLMAHAASVNANVVRDWAPCAMAFAGLCLRLRLSTRRRRSR